MAYQLVPGQKVQQATAASTTSVITLAQAPTAGNLIVVWGILGNTASKPTITCADGNNNTYTASPGTVAFSAGSQVSFYVFYLIAPPNASKTITVTCSASVTFDLSAGEFSGAYPAQSLVCEQDAFQVNTGVTSTIIAFPQIVTRTNGCLVICAGRSASAMNSGTSYAQPPYSALGSNLSSLYGGAYTVQQTAGAIGPWLGQTSGVYTSFVCSFTAQTAPSQFFNRLQNEWMAALIGGAAPVTAFAMTAATGNYTLAGENLKLLKTSIDNIQSGSYALTGQQVKTLKGSKISVQETPYTFTGEQITALKKSVQNIQEVPYTTSSQPVLKKTSLQNIQEVPYALTVEQETLKKGYADKAQTGTYALAGEQITALKTSLDKIQAGAYATSSQPVLKKANLLNAQETAYTLNTGTGVDDARSFNGTSDIISIGTPTVLDITSNITLACWVYANSLPASGANFAEFLEKGFDGSNQQYFLRFAGTGTGANGNGNWISVGTFAPASGADLQNLAVTNTWMHIAGTFDGTHWNLYFNGSNSGQIQTGTTAPIHAAAQVSFGGAYISGSPARFLNGNMADVAIWNTNLTGTQISNLAAGRRANTIGANANLVGYWPILGQSPEPDKSGNGNNGTLTGTAVVAGPPALDPFGTTVLGNETLLWDRLLNAQMTPYALTGESLTFAFSGSTSFSISIGTGTYSLTDESLTLTKASKAGLQTGVYNLTDEQLTLLKASKLVGTSGFYSFTGEQITLKAARLDKAQSGSYNLTGENEKLLKTSKTSAQTGFYNLTGENETLRRGATAFPQAGSYALTGENALLKATRLLNAQMTPYTLSGESLNLTIPAAATAAITTAFLLGMGPFAGNAFAQLPTGVTSGPITSFTISIGSGTYTITVENEKLIAARREALQTGFYSLAGGSLTITTAFPGQFTISIGTGTYALTDESLTLVKTSKQGLQVTTYSLTDEALQTLKGSRLSNTTGTYTLTGEALKLTAGHVVNPQAGFYAFTSALTFRKKSLLNSAAGFYTVTINGLNLLNVVTPIVSRPTLFGTDVGVSLSGAKAAASLLGSRNAGINLTGGESGPTLFGTDVVPGVKGSP